MYEIQNKSDFQSGATLIVRIPEEDIDKKALYTMLTEQPDFVLPFRHRVIDGQIEFTYQIGNRSKLAYMSGSRSPADYADLWLGILQPLLDCGDWFMTPYSFVLKPEYLYCDKNGKAISFVYIPSIQACSDHYALQHMVTEVVNTNPVTDISLENKVLRAIQDFNPSIFLQLVKPYKADTMQSSTAPRVPMQESNHSPAQPESTAPKPTALKPAVEQKRVAPVPANGTQKKPDDIAINFPSDGKAPKEVKSKVKKEKDIKSPPAPKEKGGFWGRKKSQPQEIIQGAAVWQSDPVHEQPIAPVYTPPTDMDDDVTQLDIHETDVPKFRYVGSDAHPRVIEIGIDNGAIFTIGRFDASVGSKQSNFEFDKATKAVSRRHVAIEHGADGYNITDLDSTAGTFINGQKLPPNAPFKLERGCRVSFGHSGADYIWEE